MEVKTKTLPKIASVFISEELDYTGKMLFHKSFIAVDPEFFIKYSPEIACKILHQHVNDFIRDFHRSKK